MKTYHYHTNCCCSTADDICPMVDSAIDITYDTFIKHVPWHEIADIFPFYCWNGRNGLHIKSDYTVSFHRSKFKGKRCYYIRHSAIEYVFV